MDIYSADLLWLVIIGFVLAFILAFGVGANDVANSYGTSVGSGVLTFRQACILATIFETSGAILLGYKVADTMRKGIIDVTIYEGSEKQLMAGMISSLTGSGIWLLIATFLRLPVSTTHSIVGSTVGFSLVVHGTEGINWKTLGMIAASWFVSPVLSGIVSVSILWLIKKFILNSTDPFEAGLWALPVIYGLTIFMNVLTVMMDGSKLLGLDNLKTWHVIFISFITMAVVVIFCKLLVVPWQKKRILHSIEPPKTSESEAGGNNSKENFSGSISTIGNSVASLSSPVLKEETVIAKKNVNKLFHFLQTLTAVFSSFAHGGNDVSNAIGPLIAIWMIYTEGSVHQKAESPIILLFYGGLGMCVGLWILGKRVIETIGKNLTKINPITGFTVESSSAATVLFASKLGIPISSTHCIVGSVACVGWTQRKDVNGQNKVDWTLFKSIILAWIITLPASGSLSAATMLIFNYFQSHEL